MKVLFRKGSAFVSKKAEVYLAQVSLVDVKNITVIRHAAIGDFMNIRPFLINLRKFFPNAKITLSVIRSSMYGIPEDLIDDIHIIDKHVPNKPSKKTTLFERLRQIKFLPPQDIMFDLTDSTLSLLLILVSRPKLTLGYSYRAIRRYFYDISTLRSDFVLETLSVQHMLSILGSSYSEPLDYGFAKKYPKSNKKRMVYFAGASVKNKCWEAEKFTELIKRLSASYANYEHVILQGIKDDEKFLDIYAPLKERDNVQLQDVLALDGALQFLADSACVISNDTGVRNMAIAVETPTVGIFFTNAPFRYWPRDGKHDCVYNLNYTSPTVDSTFKSVDNLLIALYDA